MTIDQLQGSYTEEGTMCDPSKEPGGCACFHVLHAPLNQVKTVKLTAITFNLI